jgi:hypothetical protein
MAMAMCLALQPVIALGAETMIPPGVSSRTTSNRSKSSATEDFIVSGATPKQSQVVATFRPSARSLDYP